jgi:hypothetical protein
MLQYLLNFNTQTKQVLSFLCLPPIPKFPSLSFRIPFLEINSEWVCAVYSVPHMCSTVFVIASYVLVVFLFSVQVMFSCLWWDNQIWEKLRIEVYSDTSDHDRLVQTLEKKSSAMLMIPSPTHQLASFLAVLLQPYNPIKW